MVSLLDDEGNAGKVSLGIAWIVAGNSGLVVSAEIPRKRFDCRKAFPDGSLRLGLFVVCGLSVELIEGPLIWLVFVDIAFAGQKSC